MVLKPLTTILVLIAVLVQLRLSALGLSPISFDLPELPKVEYDDRLANIEVEKIGEDDLLYPEALVIDPDERYAFASLGDGRVVRIEPSNVKHWKELSWRTLIRTGLDNIDDDGKECGRGGPSDQNNMEAKCGRPLGLYLSKRASVDPNFTEQSGGGSRKNLSEMFQDDDALLVADAYRGLLMVTGIHGNEAKVETLATRAESDPPEYHFSLLNGIVQTGNGDVYVTETSQKFQRRRIFHAAMDGAPTGRLLRYRLQKGGDAIVEVMADSLSMANGIALSHDEKSLLLVSGVSVLRFDLSSEKMDTIPFVEVMAGTGDNIKAMDQLPNGKRMKCYWAALGGKYVQPFSLLKFLSDKPRFRSLLLALVPYRKIIDLIPKWTALAVYDEQGKLVETLRDDGNKQDENGKAVGVIAPWISEVEPLGDYLYLLSWYNPFLARVKRSSIKAA